MLIVARDITERKRLEAERERLTAQDQQVKKAESLNRMAGAIAHNYNNLLGAVMGNLEMALGDLPRESPVRESLNEAMQAADRAAQLNGTMLTYLGQSRGARARLDLSDACRKWLPVLRSTMPGRTRLETDLPTPGPVIQANANQVQQILTSLATNAWEACGEGPGAIRLSVKTAAPAEIPTAHRFPLNWQPENNSYACLEVADNGCGMDESSLGNLFDPFFSTKFTGRGLGLAAVLGVVRAHRGAVAVESQIGHGSVFRVFLPMLSEQVSPLPEEKTGAPEIEGGGTVLLVDDEPTVRGVASTMLSRLGFTVLQAEDGIEAVATFRKHKDAIRFVVSDLSMPRMDGWATLAALRQITPGIPVVLASGYDQAEVLSGEHPEWPQAFLGKPFKLADLRDAIRKALKSRSASGD